MGLVAHVTDANSQKGEAGEAQSLKYVGTFPNKSPAGRG